MTEEMELLKLRARVIDSNEKLIRILGKVRTEIDNIYQANQELKKKIDDFYEKFHELEIFANEQ